MKSKKHSYAFADYPDMDTCKAIIQYGASKGGDKKQFMFHNFDDVIETKTFRQVFYDVHGLGQMLYGRGLRGKKVAILSENSYYWIAAFYSVITGKMTAIPLDPQLNDAELTELMVRSDCDAVYYSKTFSSAVEMMQKTPDVKLTEYIPIESFYDLVAEGYRLLEEGADDYLDDEVTADDLAFIVYTSGTTGKSKGVMLTQGNVAADSVASCRVMTGGHAIGFLPLYHTFSWVGALFSGYLNTEWGYICKSLRDLQRSF